MRLFHFFIASFVCAGLAGCVVGPEHRPPTPAVPEDFSVWHGGSTTLLEGRSGASAPWVSPMDGAMFRDATLDDLQARALRANADLQTAALRFAQSRALREAAAGQYAPQLGASAGAARQRLSETGTGTRLIETLVPPASRDAAIQVLSDPFDFFQAGFDASWEIDLWGRVRRGIEVADANVAAARALLAQVQWNVQTEVARRYVELRGVQHQLRIARADIAAAQASLELLRARADGGLITDLDVTRQHAQLADLRARLPPLVGAEAQVLNQLALLCGERPGALQSLLADGGDHAATSAEWPDLSLGLPSEVARRRPDIQRAEALLHAATAQTGVAVADLYPRVTLGLRFGLESLSSGDFADWGSRQWSIGPSLQLPIFDQGRRRSMLTLRELEQQEAAIAYHQSVLRAWHDIDDALNAYAAERQRHAQLTDKERRSHDALTLARVRYDNGLTDFLVQLDAERTLLQAQREYAESSSRLALDLIAIAKSLGPAAP